MSMLEAARMGDKVAHTNAFIGFVTGMVVGAVVAVGIALLLGATIATGGGALILVGALLAGLGGGALTGMKIGQRHKKGKGDPIASGADNVFIGADRRKAARAIKDKVSCHMPKVIAEGSQTVFIQGGPAARRTDQTVCGGTIDEGWPTVFIGKEAACYVPIEGEVPAWMVSAAKWAMGLGLVIGFAGAWISAGLAAAIFGTLEGVVGGEIGGRLLGWAGSFINQDFADVGEFLGGQLGGALLGAGRARAQEAVFARSPGLARALAKMPGATDPQIAARQNVARSHYEQTRSFAEFEARAQATAAKEGTPYDAAKTRTDYDRMVNSNMAGIDFTRPVYTEPILKGTTLRTYAADGEVNAGSYFTRGKADPSEIGISTDRTLVTKDAAGNDVYTTTPKRSFEVTLKEDTQGLVSTASPKVDNFNVKTADGAVAIETRGGAEQININTARDAKYGPTQAQTFETNPATNGALHPTSDTAAGYKTDTGLGLNAPPKEYTTAPVRGDAKFDPVQPGTGVTGGTVAGTSGPGDGGEDDP